MRKRKNLLEDGKGKEKRGGNNEDASFKVMEKKEELEVEKSKGGNLQEHMDSLK